MQTRKKNKYRLIGILFVVIGIIVGIIPIFLKSKEQKEMNAQIDSFLESPSSPSRTSDVVLSPPIEEEETFLMVLEIPKVNLRRGIYSKDSKWNSIEYNVTILEESNFPDEEYGNIILAIWRTSIIMVSSMDMRFLIFMMLLRMVQLRFLEIKT